MINAMIIDEKDNVVVVIEPVKKVIPFLTWIRTRKPFYCCEDIQIYHKSLSRIFC